MPETTPKPPSADEPAAAPDTAAGASEIPAPPETAPAPGIADLGPAQVAALLAERFPALFGAGRALPIKLRIQADIQQRAPGLLNKKSLSIFLHRHTTSTAYLKALAGAQQRIDLDGAPAGEIADEHRQAAVAELERRRALFEARRAAEREAQRQAHAAARREGAVPPAPGAAGPGGPGGAADNDRRSQRPGERRDGRRGDRGDARGPARKAAPGGPGAAAHRPPPGPRPERERAREVSAFRGPLDVEPRQEREAAPPLPVTAEDAARRDRALLLRTFESSTLTRANFCVLKRISEVDLEAALALARQERDQRSGPTKPPSRPTR